MYKSKGLIKEYELTRVFAVILVVIGHCTYYTIRSTNYGGIDYNIIMQSMGISDTVIHKLLSIMVSIIYSFHMPLFVALSGALFCIKFRENKYQHLKVLVQEKFYRLIIPFFLITIFYVVPLKLISGYFSHNPMVMLKEVFLGQVLLMGNSSLWYLPSLFIDFVIIYIIEKNFKCDKRIKIILLLLLHLISYKIPIPIISNPLKYAIWFYMGYRFENVRLIFNQFIKKNSIIFILSLSFFMIVYFFEIKLIGSNTLILFIKIILQMLIAILGCLITYYSSYWLTINTEIISNNFIKIISNNSFGIYLYSDTLNFLILFLIYNIFSIGVFGSEFGSLMIFMARLILTTIISIIISKIFKKNNIKYIC